MNEATRACPDCDADLTEAHPLARRCRPCARVHQRNLPRVYRKVCPDCGVEFAGRSNHTKYCSTECAARANEAHYERMRSRAVVRSGGTVVADTTVELAATCEWCSTPFTYPRPSRRANAAAPRCCSNHCRGKLRHPGNVERDCTVCGLTFTISRQYDKTECSRRCLMWRNANPGGSLVAACKWCGTDLLSAKQQRKMAITAEWCDDRCWHAWKAGISWENIRDRRCVVCDEPMPVAMHLHRVVCGDACKTRNRSEETLFRQTHARRKRLDEASVTHRVPKRVIRALRRRPCIYCGGPGGTVDHVIPLARGGHHAEGNLAPACRSCNTSKAGRLLAEWRYFPPHRSRIPGRLAWLTRTPVTLVVSASSGTG